MKVKKIIDICKKSKSMCLIDSKDEDLQYITNGCAVYPLCDLPYFNFDSICNTFDISERAREKITFRTMSEFPSNISTKDTYAGETLCERYSDMSVGKYLPIKTEIGLQFIDKQYLAPFDDMENIELYLRINETDNSIYFAVKQGFMLYGIIFPADIISEKFVCNLGEIYIQAKAVLLQQKNEGNNE